MRKLVKTDRMILWCIAIPDSVPWVSCYDAVWAELWTHHLPNAEQMRYVLYDAHTWLSSMGVLLLIRFCLATSFSWSFSSFTFVINFVSLNKWKVWWVFKQEQKKSPYLKWTYGRPNIDYRVASLFTRYLTTIGIIPKSLNLIDQF